MQLINEHSIWSLLHILRGAMQTNRGKTIKAKYDKYLVDTRAHWALDIKQFYSINDKLYYSYIMFL